MTEESGRDAPDARPEIDRPVVTAAVAFLSAIAAVHLFVVPVTVGVAVEGRGFAVDEVGDALGIAGVSYVVIVLVSPWWIARWSWKWVCGAALLINALGTFGLTQTTSYAAYEIGQILLSISLGMLFPPIMTALGSSTEPDKKYGISMVAQSLLGAAAIYVLKAYVMPAWGYEGVYGALTGYTLLGLVAIRWMPNTAKFDAPSEGGLVRTQYLSWLALVALGIYYMTVNGFTGFAERLGEHFGVRSSLIASALAVGVLLSTIGSAFVAVAGDRWGRVRPILAAAIMAVTGYGLLLGDPGDGAYFSAVLLINLSFGVIIAYAYAIIAAADPSGRFIGMATAAAGIGIAITMTLMGRIIATRGYPTFSATLIVITVIAVALMTSVAARISVVGSAN